MTEAYRQGFMRKCAEYGVDGRKLLKAAALPLPLVAMPPTGVGPSKKSIVGNTPGHNEWVSYNHTSDGKVVPVLTEAGTNYVDRTAPAPWTLELDPGEGLPMFQRNLQKFLDQKWSVPELTTEDGGRVHGARPSSFAGMPPRTPDNPGNPYGKWPGKWEISGSAPHERSVRFAPDYDAAAGILENAELGSIPAGTAMNPFGFMQDYFIKGPVKGKSRPRPLHLLTV